MLKLTDNVIEDGICIECRRCIEWRGIGDFKVCNEL